MIEKMQYMQSVSKALDDRLQSMVDQMNAATGPGKVEAMGTVINELLSQRKMMQEQMMSTMAEMMGHMKEHRKSGMMSECPMMKGMSPQAEKTAAPDHQH